MIFNWMSNYIYFLWIELEFSLNWNWIFIVLKLNFHWIEFEFHWIEFWIFIELKLNFHWIEFELSLNWQWIEIELSLNCHWIEIELSLNWNWIEIIAKHFVMMLLETDQSEVPVLTTESKQKARDTQQLQVNESVIDIICSHKSYIFSFVAWSPFLFVLCLLL